MENHSSITHLLSSLSFCDHRELQDELTESGTRYQTPQGFGPFPDPNG